MSASEEKNSLVRNPSDQNSSDRDNLDQKWQAITSSSNSLLEAARNENWNELLVQAQLRDKLIRQYFSSPITVDNALKIHDDIKQLMAMDEQLLGMARRQQDQIRGTLKDLNIGNKAVRAYQQA